MKISFRCNGCGKLLKARPDAVGWTRKCPVCATRVTCPQPVLEAEVLEAEVLEAEVVAVIPGPAPAARRGTAASAPEPAPAFNPYAEDDDDPYQLADPNPATTSAPEAQKPCPMCGEMILALGPQVPLLRRHLRPEAQEG